MNKVFYEVILRNISDGVIAADSQGRVELFNQRAQEITGWSDEYAIGRFIEEVFPLVNKETRQPIANPVSTIQDGFEIDLGKDIMVITRDCTERLISGKITPVFQENSDISGMAFIFNEQAEEYLDYKLLRENNNLLRNILASVPMSIFWKTGNSVYSGCNKVFSQQIGLDKPEDIIGKTDYDLPWPREEAEAYRSDDLEVMTGNCPKRHIIEPMQLADGKRLWVDTTKIPLVDNHGKVYGMLGIFEDITERKKAEEDLRESEAQKNAILNGITTNIAFVDRDLRIIWVNKAAAQSVDKLPDEMIGRFCHAFWANPDRPCENCPTLKAFQTKKSEHTFIYTPDGRVWDERGEPVFDENGNLIGVVEIAQDITGRKRAEEALRESEAKLKKVLEILPVGVWITDKNRKIIQSNSAAEKIWGGAKYISPEEFSEYKAWWYETREPVTNEEWGVFRAITKGEISSEELIEIECFDGTHKIIMNWAIPLLGDNKEIEGSVAVNQDITEDKYMEASLKSAYSKLHALWSVSSMAGADIKAISDHILSSIVSMTGSEYGFYGFISYDESVMTIHSWSGEVMKDCSMVNKPTRYPIGQAGVWGEAIRNRKPFIMNDYSSDHIAKIGLPEGHVTLTNLLVVPFFVNDRIVSVAAVSNRLSPYGEEDITQITSFLNTIQTIIEQKQTEEALRESEMRYRTVADFTYDWEYWLSPDNHFLYCSPSCKRITGYESEEFEKDPDLFLSITHPDDRHFLKDHLKETKETKEHELEFRILTRSGEIRWISHSCLIVLASDGEYMGHRGSNRDITERKQMYEEKERLHNQLAQSQKMESVGRLAGGVAHDFNNMLGVIMGHIELALYDLEPANPLYPALESIRSAAERSANLTRQLLAFARKQTISPRIIDMNETVEGMLTMLSRIIGEDIHLLWSPVTHRTPIKMDPSQIDQILVNLMVNARDAIGGVGKVTIETQNVVFDEDYCAVNPGFIPGNYVMLAVSDNGCGMDKKTLTNIFEPFFTTKETGKGTGLGLATVYGIVSQNNGFIKVYSEPDEGTSFRIYLPQYRDKNELTLVKGPPEAVTGGPETVLVVEDELMVIELAKTMLQKLGYTVITACTPYKAIQLAEEYTGKINLLITM